MAMFVCFFSSGCLVVEVNSKFEFPAGNTADGAVKNVRTLFRARKV